MVKSTARFGALKIEFMAILGHPAGHGRFKPKNTQNGNKSAISRGYVHFQQMLRETKTKSKKFRHPMLKSAARFGAPKIELRPF